MSHRGNFNLPQDEARGDFMLFPKEKSPISLARKAAAYFEMCSVWELTISAVLVLFMMGLRVAHILRHNFDSDEPQYLHVIWGWTHGLIPYRDLFDNHMPLFYLMLAPFVGLIGEQATILYQMRFLLLPVYLVAAFCTYRIGASLFSKRAGIWAVILVGLYYRYHFVSLEFRTDNVWALLWLLSVTVLLNKALTPQSAVGAGLLLGLCFGVSMKSSLLLLAIAVAAPTAMLLIGRSRLGYSWSYLMRCSGGFLFSAAIVPLAIIVFFAFKGLWRDFRYCVFDFNFLARGAGDTSSVYKTHPAFTLTLAILIIGGLAWKLTRNVEDAGRAFRRVFVLILCAVYFLTVKVLWPVSNRSYYLPFYPLAAVLVSGALLALGRQSVRIGRGWRRIFALTPFPALVAVGELVLLVVSQPVWKDRTRQETDLLRNVLALLKPEDYVLDCKGETVFRRRCVRLVFETITTSAIQRGLIADDTPRECVQTGTCAVATTLIRRLPPETRRFVKRNYLAVTSNLRVAGKPLKALSESGHRYDFVVTIPASYKIISREKPVSGTLDGIPYRGARFLGAGLHRFESTVNADDLILLWAQAADRHFIPMAHPSRRHG